MTSFTVGPPGPEDHAHWRELYRGYADFYQEPVTDEQLDRVWSWTPVGLAHYRPYFRPLAAAVAGHLDDLFVEPGARGTGAVDALFDGLRTIARERGWSKIRWITADDNHRARSKYDQVAERTMWVIYDMPVQPQRPV